jgi:hypothetical protein
MSHTRIESQNAFGIRLWLTIILSSIIPIFCEAFNQPVHELIAQSAVLSSYGLSQFLVENSIPDNTLLVFNGNEFPPIKWIIHGAHDEDDRLRFADHFYTLTPERVPGQVNGLTDKSETLYLEVLLFGINTLTNSFAWGTAPGIQVPLIFPILGTNAETWACARSYEYAALTNSASSDRDANMAHMFYALGHILHLNQDLS